MENFLNDLNIISVCNTENAYCVVDDSGEKPGIFLVGKEYGETVFIGFIERADRIRICCTVCYDNTVLFVPMQRDKRPYFILVKLLEKRIEYIDALNIELDFTDSYCSYLQRKENVWFFPNNINNNLVIFNINTHQYEIIEEWKESVTQLKKTEACYPRPGMPVCVQNKIYITLVKTDYVAEINADTHKICLHRISEGMDLAFPMIYDKGNFWILRAKNKGLLCWHREKGIIREISLSGYVNPLIESAHAWFRGIYVGKKYIWLTIGCDERLMCVGKEDGVCELKQTIVREDNGLDTQFYHKQSLYTACIKEKNKVMLFPEWAKQIFYLDLERDIIQERYNNIKYPIYWKIQEILIYLGRDKGRQLFLKDDCLTNLIYYIKNKTIFDNEEKRLECLQEDLN